MKRLRETRRASYSTLLLYREDLEEILHLFNSNEQSPVVEISDGEAEYESLDEMRAQIGDRVRKIKLSCKHPWIILTLEENPPSMSLYTMEATDEADVAFFRTHQFLQRKTRRLALFVGGALVPICNGVILATLGLLFNLTSLKQHSWIVLSVFVLAMLATIYFLTKLGNTMSMFVSLAKRTESPSFWQRKKDDLIMLVIGAVVGGFLGVIATKLIDRLVH